MEFLDEPITGKDFRSKDLRRVFKVCRDVYNDDELDEHKLDIDMQCFNQIKKRNVRDKLYNHKIIEILFGYDEDLFRMSIINAYVRDDIRAFRAFICGWYQIEKNDIDIKRRLVVIPDDLKQIRLPSGKIVKLSSS